MISSTDVDARPTDLGERHVPAYGPVEAVLGYALFYVLVERTTPTITATFTEVLSFSPETIGLGLAVALWFVGLLTALDQVRRQLAAVGVGSHEAVRRDESRPRTLSETRALGYLSVFLVGSLLALWTADVAMSTVVAMIRVVSAVDVGGFVLSEFVVVAIFFVAYGAATHALDRLVIGGIRGLLAE